MAQGEDGAGPESGPARGKGGFLRGAAVAAVIVFAGLVWWAAGRPQEGAPTRTPPVAAPAADPVSPVSVPALPVAKPAPETAASQVAPAEAVRFDMLRAAPDGAVTVAGAAAPGAKVEVLIDGVLADTVTAGADGRFASVMLGAPSAAARVLSLRVTGADGVAVTARESLTIAPSAVAVAAAGASEDTVAQAEALAEKPLLADAQGVRALAPASADLVIDTVAFDATGRVEISGRGAPGGALLRAYVDNVEAGLTAPGPDGGWRILLPQAAAGPHILRVDALDAEGKVLSRAETEFTAAAPEVLRAAAPGAGEAVTVREGLTLWAVAREVYGDPMMYVRVFEANRDQIRDPNLIYPGQVFTLPAMP